MNDRFWKYEYANWITGKLSDFLGLFSFSLFLGIVVPSLRKRISLIVGIAFVIWKTPLSNGIISQVNRLINYEIARTIDYSDFIALFVLLASNYILTNLDIEKLRTEIKLTINPVILNILIFFSIFVFSSTSIREPSYPIGNIMINESYQVNGTNQEVFEKIKTLGSSISLDSIQYLKNGAVVIRKYNQIDKLILENNNILDTIENINFYIYERQNESTITIINMRVNNSIELQDWKILKKRSKLYKKLLKRQFIEKLKN